MVCKTIGIIVKEIERWKRYGVVEKARRAEEIRRG